MKGSVGWLHTADITRRQKIRKGYAAMTAIILKFPPRGVFANAVHVERERDGDGWLTLADACGSLHGDFASALREAHEIAASCGRAVISSNSTIPAPHEVDG